MRKYLVQMAIAIMMSLSVLGSTIFWYQSMNKAIRAKFRAEIIADVNDIANEVERKPVNSLVWKEIVNSDLLYDGEAIRTLEQSTVRIHFRDTGSFLNLEPESLVVIRKSRNEVALDLMEGSIQVAQEEDHEKSSGTKTHKTQTAQLVLNSKKGKIDLTQATANLSKSLGDDLSVQVLKGRASFKNDQGQEKQIEQGTSGILSSKNEFKMQDLKILSPKLDRPYYAEPSTTRELKIEWQGFSPNAKVEVWMGSSPKKLSLTSEVQNHDSKGMVPQKFSIGKSYWKLIARDPLSGQTLGESALNRTEILSAEPPQFTGPADQAVLVFDKLPAKISFTLRSQIAYKFVKFELAESSDFQKNRLNYTLNKEKGLSLEIKSPGTFFWRHTTQFEGLPQGIESKTLTFQVRSKEDEFTPITINWDLLEAEKIQHFVKSPEIKFKWKPSDPRQIRYWKLSYSEQGSDSGSKSTRQIDANSRSWKEALKKPGRYTASIEAFDGKNRSLGVSPAQELKVEMLPLVESPAFENKGPIIKAKPNGEATLTWTAPKGAKVYTLRILKNGKELRKQSYTKNETTIKKLRPGEYELEVTAIDEHGRVSQGQDKKKLLVPELSDLKAPKLLKMSIKK